MTMSSLMTMMMVKTASWYISGLDSDVRSMCMKSEGPRIGVVTLTGSLLPSPHCTAAGDEPFPVLGAWLMERALPGR